MAEGVYQHYNFTLSKGYVKGIFFKNYYYLNKPRGPCRYLDRMQFFPVINPDGKGKVKGEK